MPPPPPLSVVLPTGAGSAWAPIGWRGSHDNAGSPRPSVTIATLRPCDPAPPTSAASRDQDVTQPRGGEGCREHDPPPGGGASSEQIMRTGALLLRGFIRDHVERCGDEAALALGRAELGAEPEAGPAPGAGPARGAPDTKRLGECLRRIGDELDRNAELQRMIADVGCEAPKELFFRVAAEIFSDGAFNWGRVVALFYFACKLVLK
ncbi:apoptosis regulator BAX-like, partial [Pezoporus flaviventris]|uniref:apoptosis regulator BAX-like n=1 Tax=Pezoporus flaviventris TaxID=889875 RepID=UPI002AB056A1